MAEPEEYGYAQEPQRSLGFRDLVIYGMGGTDVRDDAATEG